MNAILRNLFTIVLILIFLFIGITGGLIQKHEHIPDNAEIFVFPSHQLWLPNAPFVKKKLNHQAQNPKIQKKLRDMWANKHLANYKDVQEGGNFAGYQLPEGWQDRRKEFLWGRDQSLLMFWIFPEQKRWNADGSWNY